MAPGLAELAASILQAGMSAVALGHQLLRRDGGYITSWRGISGGANVNTSPMRWQSPARGFSPACLSFPWRHRAVGACWGGSGKWVYFRSSPGSCRSEFVAPGITNASLRQLAAGDESDRQHHGADSLLAGQLGAMPLAKGW